MLDRDDFEAFKERKPINRQKRNGETWNLEFLAQAEVRQKNLTGQPEWDRFLSYLEGHRKRLVENKDVLERALCSSSMVDTSEIMATKLAIARVGGLLDMLEGVLELPRSIMETGEKARERLKEFET